MTLTEETRERFWKGFYNRLGMPEIPMKPRKSPPRSTHYFPTDLPISEFTVVYNAYKSPESVGYALNVPHQEDVWSELKKRQEEIEQRLNEEVELAGPDYENSSQKYTVRVSIDESIFGIEDPSEERETWREYYGWYIDQGRRCWEIVQELEAVDE
jgi:hypothetical protein